MDIREKIEALETEKIRLRAVMTQSDGRAAKCMKTGVEFKSTYPEDFRKYTEANARYNEIEQELPPLRQAAVENDLETQKANMEMHVGD